MDKKTISLHIGDNYDRSNYYEDHMLTMEGRLACSMIGRWGMLAADVDGEDSAGRQKGRLLTPDELVARAFTTADLVMREAQSRGLLAYVPLESAADRARRKATEEAEADEVRKAMREAKPAKTL